MTDQEQLEAIVATELERLAYMARIGDRGTAGPDEHPPAARTPDVAPFWKDGWWLGARQVPAHPGRVGAVIAPMVIVDHTTDMHPDDWDALVNAWRTKPGDGACAHFLVGRDEGHGVAQLMPITRNGNHAGGPGHGVFVDDGHEIHPNLLAIGIEYHCAGGQLRLINGEWRFVEDGKIHGAPIPAADVEPDPARPGRGWHRLSAFQIDTRAKLHADLERVLHAMPAGLRAVSKGESVPSWGVPKSARRVGHVSLDPTHRADPWPNGMRALR